MRACALPGHAAANDLLAVYAEDWGPVQRHGLCARMAEKKSKKRPLQILPKEVEEALLAGLSASALFMQRVYFLSL